MDNAIEKSTAAQYNKLTCNIGHDLPLSHGASLLCTIILGGVSRTK